MNRTAELGEYIQSKLDDASNALKRAESDPVGGAAAARSAIRAARAVIRLLEPADKAFRGHNDALGAASSRLSPILDLNARRTIPPPVSPSMLAAIRGAEADVLTARSEIREMLVGLKIPNIEVVTAAGRSYRQARRRFLAALPDEDEAYGLEALDRCRKATLRVHLQADALLRGHHTRRSARFGELGELIAAHRDLVALGTTDGPSLAQLEVNITKLGLELFKRKPSAHREWLHDKMVDDEPEH